ncbi:MAG: hypothetical protein HLUCCX10_17305, partial [Algoriphagus marincola HL-49]
ARHIEAQYERSEMLGKKVQITTPALGQNFSFGNGTTVPTRESKTLKKYRA